MALLNIFDIAGSALTAQSKRRLNVAASNLPTPTVTVGPTGNPYRAKQAVFQVDAAPGAATGGVKAGSWLRARRPTSWFTSPQPARGCQRAAT